MRYCSYAIRKENNKDVKTKQLNVYSNALANARRRLIG